MSSLAVETFFEGNPDSRHIHGAVERVIRRLGDVGEKASKSQVAFARDRGFAWTWMPGQYLSGERPPLVLSIRLQRRDPSPRWKEVVEPRPGQFMHHLELYSEKDVDDEVATWLREAWEDATH